MDFIIILTIGIYCFIYKLIMDDEKKIKNAEKPKLTTINAESHVDKKDFSIDDFKLIIDSE